MDDHDDINRLSTKGNKHIAVCHLYGDFDRSRKSLRVSPLHYKWYEAAESITLCDPLSCDSIRLLQCRVNDCVSGLIHLV
jgi:hypothetical protein